MAILTTLQNLKTTSQKIFDMPENYIYLYHTGTFILIPTYADQINDSIQVTYLQSAPLGRSAPIYSYAHSGPRGMQITLHLHRDMMRNINYGISNANLGVNDDYIDYMIKNFQSAALPAYNDANKIVNPPVVALRMGKDIFIKGIIEGQVGVTYGYPVLRNGKYAKIDITFNVKEIDPFSAQTVAQLGSNRGVDSLLERQISSTAGYNMLT